MTSTAGSLILLARLSESPLVFIEFNKFQEFGGLSHIYKSKRQIQGVFAGYEINKQHLKGN